MPFLADTFNEPEVYYVEIVPKIVDAGAVFCSVYFFVNVAYARDSGMALADVVADTRKRFRVDNGLKLTIGRYGAMPNQVVAYGADETFDTSTFDGWRSATVYLAGAVVDPKYDSKEVY